MLAIEVGRALKKVDRTLFKDWAKWCERIEGPKPQKGEADWTGDGDRGKAVPSLFTFNVVTALWDVFEPVACDVHSANYSQVGLVLGLRVRVRVGAWVLSRALAKVKGIILTLTLTYYSQVREVFSKLANRPGLDFKTTFNDFADKILSKRVKRMVERERLTGVEFTAKIKADLRKNVTLSKTDMASLLVEMGVSMKDNEMRLLVDAFDADGDGVVTLSEFLAFTGFNFRISVETRALR
jgi:hypothetical protein